MNTIAVLVALAFLGLLVYSGVRDGAFFSIYVLMRNLFGFLLAMALMEPLASFLMLFTPKWHPWPQYSRSLAFPLVFALFFALARWLKMRFTPAKVPTFPPADRIVGGACGMLNWVVLVGILLILWSLMPFAKFIPGDFGRIKTDSGLLFPGKAMLRFYKFTTNRMPGGRVFLLDDEPVVDDADGDNEFDPDTDESFEDVNNNGVWDRGWLWRYKNHADFHVSDVELVTSAEET